MAERLRALAHDVRSLHNVGAIMRSADGAGCSEVLLSGFTGSADDPRARKVSLGAERSVGHRTLSDLDELLAQIADDWLIVLEQHQHSVPLDQVELNATRQITVCVCGELQGAPQQLLERADAIAEIPMRGSKESLNVSVAFGIGIYAIADRLFGVGAESLRSRQERSPVREGVLTRGQSRGERPNAATAGGE